MKKVITLPAAVFLLLITCFGVRAEDDACLDNFARKLDNIERRFWSVAVLPTEHVSRSRFAGEIDELKSAAIQIKSRCRAYKPSEKAIGTSGDKINAYMKNTASVPQLLGDVDMLIRVLDSFRRDPKIKMGRVTLNGTGMSNYRRRHNKLMKEREEEQSEGKRSSRRRNMHATPKLSQVDMDDYVLFLEETNSTNTDKFSSYVERLKVNSKIQLAEGYYSTYQASVYNMRIKLVSLAKYGTFRGDKNGSRNNLRQNNSRTDK